MFPNRWEVHIGCGCNVHVHFIFYVFLSFPYLPYLRHTIRLPSYPIEPFLIISSKDSSSSQGSIPCSPVPFPQTSFESIDELRPGDAWRRMSIFPPPPPPTVCVEEPSENEEQEKVDCRALLVIKALPKSWLQTKKEVMHKWKVNKIFIENN